MATRWLLLFRAASAACLAVGILLVGSFAYSTYDAHAQQHRLDQQWQTLISHPLPRRELNPTLMHPVNGIDFAIRVPKLRYYAAVKEGVDWNSLYAGPGHYPTTMWPGQEGTVGVAAHNEYWINFPQLKSGDEVDIETRYGTYRYHVTGSEIVNPDNRSVLVPDSPGFHLMLTTCWPTWAGVFATKRYVIFTDQFWPIPTHRNYD